MSDINLELELAAAAAAAKRKRRPGVMGEVNRGIAEAVGGVVDFVNPFNDPAWQGTALGTGSAQDALAAGMERIGARVAPAGEPEGVVAGFSRGVGRAAGALPTVVGGLSAASRIPGVVGAAAQSARGAIATPSGMAIEAAAGGLSEGGAQAVAQAGGSQLAQDIAQVATPMAIPAAGYAAGQVARGAVAVGDRLPLTSTAINAGRQVARAVLPMTETGARQVAREELSRRVGDTGRMRDLGKMIDPQDTYGRTGAQQTGDPALLGLEDAARAENPMLRERLDARMAETQSRMLEDLTIPGDIRNTRAFFTQRLRTLREGMERRTRDAIRSAREGVQAVGRDGAEGTVSARMVENLQSALQREKELEREAWSMVPRDVLVPTSEAKSVARSLRDSLSQAEQQSGAFPKVIENVLLSNSGLADEAPHFELKGLYSTLRDISREAAATGQNNVKRIADQVADAILRDFDNAETGNAAYAQARAVTRALHETFDRGAVGRILARDRTGANRIEPEAAARRTLQQGPEGAAAATRIANASPEAGENIGDFLRTQFLERALSPDGEVTRSRAATWMRANSDLLAQNPRLRAEFSRALGNQKNAEEYAASVRLRQKIIEQSPVAGVTRGYVDEAADAILRADDPASAARSVVRAARQQEDGSALAGVKAALSDRLISQATNADGALTGSGMAAVLRNSRMQAALRQVYSTDEMKRLNQVADAVAKMDVAPTEAGRVINAKANQMLLNVVQFIAAGRGGAMGAKLGGAGLGGGIKGANLASNTAGKIMESLTNARARRLLMDAVEDPDLMRVLLMNETAVVPPPLRAKIAPYLAGAGANVAVSGE